jgi:glycerol uptake facilitator protein
MNKMPRLLLSFLLVSALLSLVSGLRPYVRSPLFQRSPITRTNNRNRHAPVNAKSAMSSSNSSQDTEEYDSSGHPKAPTPSPPSEQQQRPTLKSRASMSLFRFRAETPEGETTGYWNRQRSGFARELLAECFGTFIIVQLGTGVVMSDIFAGAMVGLFQIAAVWIIAVTLAICCTASISGAHLNPAISITFALLRRSKSFGWSKVIPYILAQTTGAILASCVNLMLYASLISQFEAKHNIVRSSAGAIASARAFGEYYAAPVTTATAFFAEAFGTAVLAGVIFALTHPGNDTMKHNVYIPPFIGLTVGGLITVIAPLTQAGFNPARDFGPRIVAYLAGWKEVAFLNCWVYIVAPIVGAPLGAMFVDKVLYYGQDKGETAATSHD